MGVDKTRSPWTKTGAALSVSVLMSSGTIPRIQP